MKCHRAPEPHRTLWKRVRYATAWNPIDSSPSNSGEQPCRHAADAHRKSEHQHEDDRTENAAPEFGVTRKDILQPGKRRGADQWPGKRVDSAKEHDQQGVDRPRNGQ